MKYPLILIANLLTLALIVAASPFATLGVFLWDVASDPAQLWRDPIATAFWNKFKKRI